MECTRRQCQLTFSGWPDDLTGSKDSLRRSTVNCGIWPVKNSSTRVLLESWRTSDVDGHSSSSSLNGWVRSRRRNERPSGNVSGKDYSLPEGSRERKL